MKTYEDDVALVKALQNGEECYIFWSEEMGGHVQRFYDIYSLSEVTGYGHYEHLHGTYSYEQIEQMVMIAHTWT